MTSFVNGRNDYINAVCVPVGKMYQFILIELTVGKIFYAYHYFVVILGFGRHYYYTNAPPIYRSRFVEALHGP